MQISEARKRKLIEKIERARTSKAPENAVGQWIAGFFEAGVESILKEIVDPLPEYHLSLPPGKRTWRLSNIYGEKRQIDYVISDNDRKPIVIIEDKWLKDQRHLKDKGSWVIAMQGVQKANPSIRAIIAILAGEWNETTIKALENVAYVFHIPTETVYSKLESIGIKVVIDKDREAFEDPPKLLEDILVAVEKRLPDRDIIAELGKDIVKEMTHKLQQKILDILYPKPPEIADRYELTVTTNWGRIYRVTGKCIEKPPKEIMNEVRKKIEEAR